MTTPRRREPENIPRFSQRDLPDVDTTTGGPDEIVLPDETTTEGDGEHRSRRESNGTPVR